MTQTVSQALARKWRPRDFESLVGQEHVVKALSHALDHNRLHHAYLFTGTRGVGKTTIARILARAVNCEVGVSSTPCGKCQACLEINQGRFVDLLEVDAATNTKVDEMRTLLENAMYAPTAGRYKVYVIDEVHMLSSSAFNAMLKTLEEPPEHVLFILATTDPQKIPATVLSRCLQFSLRQLLPDQIVEHLGHILGQESMPFEPAALRLLAKAARGSLRDALSLTDQAIAYCSGNLSEQAVRQMLGAVDQQVILQVLQALANSDGKALIEVAQGLSAISAPFGALLDELAAASYRLSVAQLAGGFDPNDPDDAALIALESTFGPEDLQLFYQIATHARGELHLAPEESIGFSMALLRMLAFKPSTHSVVAGSPHLPPSRPAAMPKPAVAQPAPAVVRPTEVPVRATAEAQVARPAFASSDQPSASNWPTLSQQIPAKGLLRQALVQAEFVDCQKEGEVMRITLKTAIKTYTEVSMVNRLESLLTEYFAQAVRLNMTYGEVQLTAHAVQSENRRQAMDEAKQSLDSDPFLNDIQSLMGGTVVQGSERPLNSTGPADV
jgi:DNA polymerase-3 subunit gamma/tau